MYRNSSKAKVIMVINLSLLQHELLLVATQNIGFCDGDNFFNKESRDHYPLDCKGSNISQYLLANVEVASSQYNSHHRALGTAEKDFQMILYLQQILP